MDTTKLRALFELLREFNVLKFAGEGVSVELGGAVSVHKHASEPAEPRETRQINPKLVEAYKKLPGVYQDFFVLGEG